MTDARGINGTESEPVGRRDQASRDRIIAKTASLLKSLPTPTLIDLLCEIAKLSPGEDWPVRPPGSGTSQWVLHRKDP